MYYPQYCPFSMAFQLMYYVIRVKFGMEELTVGNSKAVINNESVFKSRLKTFLFSRAFSLSSSVAHHLATAALKLQPHGIIQICLLLLLQCLLLCLQCFDAVGWVAGRASGL